MIGLLLMDCPLTGYLARMYFQFPLSLSCGRNAAYKGLFTANKFLRAMFLILTMLSLWNWIGFLAGVAKGVTAAVSPSPPFCRMWLILDGFALGTSHVKMLLFARQFPSERLSELLALTPFCFDAFSAPCIVAEISMLPVVWLGDMTRLATELGR